MEIDDHRKLVPSNLFADGLSKPFQILVTIENTKSFYSDGVFFQINTFVQDNAFWESKPQPID